MKILYFAGQLGRSFLTRLFGGRVEGLLSRFGARVYIFKFRYLNKKSIIRSLDAEDGRVHLHAGTGNQTLEKEKPDVAIIVPVFNACDELKACLESIIAKTLPPYRLLVIDDASTDLRIRPLLEHFKTYPNVIIAYNKTNLGYTATINKGCKMAGTDDVVLLNSDTQVTHHWLNKLSDCARMNPRTATVTPLSNAAGVFSVPEKYRSNHLPEFLSLEDMGRLVEKLSMRLVPQVPTGNGYCLYITRRALEQVGEFDERSFPRGYGEENDFCMRASRKGFIHLIDDSTYIYHQKTASHKEGRQKIIGDSMHQLNQRYPEYKYLISKWMLHDPLDIFRKKLHNEIIRLRSSMS